jgi:hypothetical protein
VKRLIPCLARMFDSIGLIIFWQAVLNTFAPSLPPGLLRAALLSVGNGLLALKAYLTLPPGQREPAVQTFGSVIDSAAKP